MHVQGSVVIDAEVTVEGQVEDLQLVSGDPLLAAAAMDAVRQMALHTLLPEWPAHPQGNPNHHQLYRAAISLRFYVRKLR